MTFFLTLAGCGLAGCVGVEAPPPEWPTQGCALTPPSGPVPSASTSGVRLRVTDGVRLEVVERIPRGGGCWPMVVLVPPGFAPGQSLLDGELAERLLEEGIAVASFDPRGRGASEGAEDANGAVGQEDLAQVLRWVASGEEVDPTAVVLSSRSFGAALAAGALGRFGDLQPTTWVDYEGPADLEAELPYVPEQSLERMTALAEASGDPATFYAERSPLGFIGEVSVPYHRVQGLPDHALQAYTAHAAAMVDGAVASPEVRYNGELVEIPLGPEAVKEGAIEGGVDAEGEWVSGAIEGALAGRW